LPALGERGAFGEPRYPMGFPATLCYPVNHCCDVGGLGTGFPQDGQNLESAGTLPPQDEQKRIEFVTGRYGGIVWELGLGWAAGRRC
jgi:hypothetical protein